MAGTVELARLIQSEKFHSLHVFSVSTPEDPASLIPVHDDASEEGETLLCRSTMLSKALCMPNTATTIVQ